MRCWGNVILSTMKLISIWQQRLNWMAIQSTESIKGQDCVYNDSLRLHDIRLKLDRSHIWGESGGNLLFYPDSARTIKSVSRTMERQACLFFCLLFPSMTRCIMLCEAMFVDIPNSRCPSLALPVWSPLGLERPKDNICWFDWFDM